MMRIWKETGFVSDDAWIMPAADGSFPEGDAERRVLPLSGLPDPSGAGDLPQGVAAILVAPADDVRRLAPLLPRLRLIALAFPAFNDGRAFSHAGILRSVLGYGGEIRAVGDVLIDQIPLMQRCGIDSFAVSNPVALKRLEEGRLNGIPLHYQPAVDDGAAPEAGYRWRRAAHPPVTTEA